MTDAALADAGVADAGVADAGVTGVRRSGVTAAVVVTLETAGAPPVVSLAAGCVAGGDAVSEGDCDGDEAGFDEDRAAVAGAAGSSVVDEIGAGTPTAGAEGRPRETFPGACTAGGTGVVPVGAVAAVVAVVPVGVVGAVVPVGAGRPGVGERRSGVTVAARPDS